MFNDWFSGGGQFMPHGHCYLWTPGLVWLHVISDSLIALPYYSIPLTLFYFVRRRQGIQFNTVFLCFAVFIFACGTTHLMEIWNVWHSAYWLSGGIKAVTAVASVPTAILVIKLVPRALLLRSPAELEAVNRELEKEVDERTKAEEATRRTARELEEFNQLMVGRELRMVELKREINELNATLGRPAPYEVSAAGEGEGSR